MSEAGNRRDGRRRRQATPKVRREKRRLRVTGAFVSWGGFQEAGSREASKPYRVQHGDPERSREWDVLDRDGAGVASVGLPAVDRVLEIGRDYLLGTWSDELDVEYVGLFPVSRG